MLNAQVLQHSGVDALGDLLRPALDVPEVTRAEEVQVDGLGLRGGVILDAVDFRGGGGGGGRGGEHLAASPRNVCGDEADFLLDVLRSEYLAEILYLDVAPRGGVVGGVVFPAGGVDAPLAPRPRPRPRVQFEPADEHAFAPALLQRGDVGGGIPLFRIRGDDFIVQHLREGLVRDVEWALALEGYQHRFGRVGRQELVCRV